MAAVVLDPNEKVVGIDLGTSTSVVATLEAGEPSVVPNAEGERFTPSVVAFTKEGELLVGEVAKRQAVLNPDSTFHSVKRFIGRRYDEVTEEVASFPYKVLDVNDKVRIDCPALGKQLPPEEIAAHILRKLRTDAESHLNSKVQRAVITVPAYFDDTQRQATKEAGRLAGLEVLRIVNEPTMAALAYGLDQRNLSTILVLDLGGGTYDVSVLEVGDGVVEVMATNGDTHLGGNDFDQRIINWVADAFQEKEGVDLRQDPQALSRIQEASERAKKDLSELSEARISVPFITADENGPKHIDEVLTRDEFTEMCMDLVMRLAEPVLQTLKDIRYKMQDMTEVVLVGGSCRIPAVQMLIGELTQFKPVNNAINPDEVVAIGAAVQAAMIVGEAEDIMLIDVTPLTLGVETNGGVFTPVVERNTAIPTKGTRLFTTSEDAQDSIEVVVLQGERPLAADNKKLETFRLEGIPPAPAGIPKIEVTFEIDVNGILSVSAKDWATRQQRKVTVDGVTNVEEREVELIIQDAEDNWLTDEDRKDQLELVHSAKCLVRQTHDNLHDLGTKVPEDARQSVLPRLTALEASVKRAVAVEESGTGKINYQELDTLTKDLRFELMRLGTRVWGKQLAPDNTPGPARPRPAGGVAGGGAPDPMDFM